MCILNPLTSSQKYWDIGKKGNPPTLIYFSLFFLFSWQPSILGLTMGNPNRTKLISTPKWRNKANRTGAKMEAAKHLR